MSEKDFEERDKIVKTAQRLITADGFDMVSVADIAKEAGISEETLNKYFKNKDELVMELIGKRFNLITDELLNKPLQEKVKLFNFEIMRQIELPGFNFCKGWIINQFNHVNYYHSSNDISSGDIELFKSLLEASIAKGELREDTPIRDFAVFDINTVYGLMLHWALSDSKYEPLYHIDTFSDFVVNAMIPYMNKYF